MMKGTPLVRSETAPTAVAIRAEATIAAGHWTSPLSIPWALRMPTVYTPTPR